MLSLSYTKTDNFSLTVCLIASTASSHLFLACFKVFETFHYNITHSELRACRMDTGTNDFYGGFF